MDELNKNLEGEKIDSNLEGTSTSVTVDEEEGKAQAETSQPAPELNSSPVPTKEEQVDADLTGGDNSSSDINAGTDAQVNVGVSGGSEGASPESSDTPVVTETVSEETKTVQQEPEKTFTQSQVNDLVGKTRMETREQTFKAVYGRYGVEDEAGMDELVGNAQRYETVRGEFDEARKGWEASDAAKASELAEVKEHVALLESGIDRARFDDAKAIMKAKGLEITVENINNELATHPEWKGAGVKPEEVNTNFHQDPNKVPHEMKPTPESTIKVLGNEGNPSTGGMSEEEYALKNLFKI